MTGVRDFPARVKCAPLSWHTVHAALNDQTKYQLNIPKTKRARKRLPRPFVFPRRR